MNAPLAALALLALAPLAAPQAIEEPAPDDTLRPASQVPS